MRRKDSDVESRWATGQSIPIGGYPSPRRDAWFNYNDRELDDADGPEGDDEREDDPGENGIGDADDLIEQCPAG